MRNKELKKLIEKGEKAIKKNRKTIKELDDVIDRLKGFGVRYGRWYSVQLFTGEETKVLSLPNGNYAGEIVTGENKEWLTNINELYIEEFQNIIPLEDIKGYLEDYARNNLNLNSGYQVDPHGAYIKEDWIFELQRADTPADFRKEGRFDGLYLAEPGAYFTGIKVLDEETGLWLVRGIKVERWYSQGNWYKVRHNKTNEVLIVLGIDNKTLAGFEGGRWRTDISSKEVTYIDDKIERLHIEGMLSNIAKEYIGIKSGTRLSTGHLVEGRMYFEYREQEDNMFEGLYLINPNIDTEIEVLNRNGEWLIQEVSPIMQGIGYTYQIGKGQDKLDVTGSTDISIDSMALPTYGVTMLLEESEDGEIEEGVWYSNSVDLNKEGTILIKKISNGLEYFRVDIGKDGSIKCNLVKGEMMVECTVWLKDAYYRIHELNVEFIHKLDFIVKNLT